ncbi:MAG: phosphatidate cytidylyltransferase [Gammaproteobacteria bacterium]
MLKLRVISALIMAPLVIYGVLFLDNPVFSMILGVVLLAGAWEWSHLIPLRTIAVRLAYTCVLGVLMWLLWRSGLERLIKPLLLLALVWWLCALLWLSQPKLLAQASLLNSGLKMLAGVLVLLPAWAALSSLHASGERGPTLTLMLLMLVWLADIGAYFAGRQWGHRKLAPAVSPGKTWEGVYGGLFSSLLFAAIAGWFFSRALDWTLAFMMVAAVTVMFSVAGDLLESLMKRQSGIKDSGHIIPGHGGIFDRIDSLVAAAPMFLIGFLWLAL